MIRLTMIAVVLALAVTTSTTALRAADRQQDQIQARLHDLFQAKCRMCHEGYRALAKLELILRANRLVGRYSDHDVLEFMDGHGHATAEEAKAITKRLIRIRKALDREQDTEPAQRQMRRQRRDRQ